MTYGMHIPPAPPTRWQRIRRRVWRTIRHPRATHAMRLPRDLR